MMDLTHKQWVKHVIFHPFEGFEDMRWKKAGSIKIAMFIVGMLFIATVANRQLVGFQFNSSYVKVFNIVPLLVRSVVYFGAWVVGNWSICTLLDGEGTMKKICTYSAYSLVPFIIGSLTCTFISNFITVDEVIWANAIYYIGQYWSVLLMFSAMKAVHQYSFLKTLFSLILTIIAMLAILFLLVLMVTLFQQVYVFFYSIYTEVAYRIRG